MRTFGILGYPLIASFSQPYFQQKFIDEKIDNCEYLKFPIEHIDSFPEVLAAHPNLAGFNITIPHKQSILQYVHEQTDVVRHCGATNCIKIKNGKLIAYNTDVIGFEESLKPLLQPLHTNALVLGTGGAALAVVYVLKKLGIAYKYVSRSKRTDDTVLYTEIDAAAMQQYKLIINASPAGMIPHEDTYPALPYEHMSSEHLLYDLVYKPAETLFLQKGKAQGAITKNGFEMLILQAEAAWKIWNE